MKKLKVLQFMAISSPFLMIFFYAQMKPEPAATTLERTLQIPFSIEMGIRVAQLVKSKGMVPQVVVNSFDVLKSLNAKKVSFKTAIVFIQ